MHIIKAHFELNSEEHYELKKVEIDKATLHKVIKQITIHPKQNNSQMIEVLMNNGNSFSLEYKA